MRLLPRLTAIVLMALLLTFTMTLPARAADATVLVCDFATLSTAVTTANTGGGTITFTCSGTITFTGELFISDTVIIEGGGAITFDGGGTTRLFSIGGGSSLTLNNLTLQNGDANAGGAVYVSGELIANSVTFSGNNANALNGGAIRNFGITTISNSTFTANTAVLDGGAIYSDGTSLTITNSSFSGNFSEDGGAIFNFGPMTISGSDFQTNYSEVGGAIQNQNTATITNSTFSNNYTTFGNGGAIQHGGTYLFVGGSTFTNNSAFDRGGGIRSTGGPVDLENSIFINNSANVSGGSLHVQTGLFTIENTHFEIGDCVAVLDTFTDNGGNTTNAIGCPGTPPITLSLSGLTCNGDNAQFTINSGDGTFSISDTTAGVSITNSPAGLITLTGPATWTDVIVGESGGERQMTNIGGITCPSGVIIPPILPPAPSATTPTVLGCALDTADGVDVANAPDNTYCRILMRNNGVVAFSGAVPSELIGLGVILAVDVYRLEGGASQNTFPAYAQVCLAGQGRLFYMDGRNAPRVSIELATETLGGATCGWIPAPGTLILTN